MRSSITMYSSRFCPFCVRAKSLLKSKGVQIEEILVDGNAPLRQEMMEKSGRHTVPQIWIGARHVGGCDELMALDRAGKLDKLLASA